MTNAAKLKGGLVRRKTSRWWYGRYQVDGKSYTKNLRVEVMGRPPSEREEHGSPEFEKSKGRAEAELSRLLSDIEAGRPAEELAQAVHQARTGGRRVKVYDLTDLPDLWDNIPRSKPVSGQHKQISLAWIQGFVDYCQDQWPSISKLDHLSAEHARQFMLWQEERGISARTWNAILGALKAACRRGRCTAFDDLRQKKSDTVHRVPYSPEELKAIFDAAKSDRLLYPLVVTAACTAMRRGDCCTLKWSSVDLTEGFVSVKTSKTGRSVDIPIADMLREVIERELGNGSEYVFPELADQCARNAKMLTDRLRKILAQAGFHDGAYVPAGEVDNFEPVELIKKAEAYLSSITLELKRTNALRLLEAYVNGATLCKAAAAVGISKSTASAYLNEIEVGTGVTFIRGKKRPVTGQSNEKRGDVHVEREQGLRKASVRDFHSFRTTWITLALCAGIPFELVQQVTGHATAEIVMEHYFKPQRAQLKIAIEKSMPNLLTAGGYSSEENAIKLLRQMNSQNWRKLRGEVIDVLLGVQ
jgi:integrase